MAKILITGGTGFIGTNLSIELQKRGHEVIVSDLKSFHLDNSVRCDVSKFEQVERLFLNYGKFDFVYHLAAEYGRWNGEDHYSNLWETNIIGHKNILRMQEKLRFKMIFFSSAEVYGDFEGIMTEDVMIKNPIKDTYQMNDYAISKWSGELMCLNSIKNFGTETVIVRPVNCYGPHEHYTSYRGFIPKFIYHALNRKPYIVYKNHKRIIDYVEDTTFTVANIIDNFKSGEAYNLGSDPSWNYDIKYYSDLIHKLLGINHDFVIYKEAENNTTKVKQISSEKAIRDLKHNPKIDPEEGLSRTINWIKNYYNIS